SSARGSAVRADRWSLPAAQPHPAKAQGEDTSGTPGEGLAAHRPLLTVYEDAHWIDPTSLELLGLTVDRVIALPVLLLITFRSEVAPRWIGSSHVTLVRLGGPAAPTAPPDDHTRDRRQASAQGNCRPDHRSYRRRAAVH